MGGWVTLYPKAIRCLEDGSEESIFYACPQLDARKILSTNGLERLNQEICWRSSVVGIFRSADAYARLENTYLIEYMEDRLPLGLAVANRLFKRLQFNFLFYRIHYFIMIRRRKLLTLT